MEAGSWFCCPCPRGKFRKPGTCSLKWADWCLSSPGLSVGDVGSGLGWFLPLLYLRVRSDVASLEFSVRDVAERAARVFFYTIRLALSTYCYFRPPLGLSVRDVDRDIEVGVCVAGFMCKMQFLILLINGDYKNNMNIVDIINHIYNQDKI